MWFVCSPSVAFGLLARGAVVSGAAPNARVLALQDAGLHLSWCAPQRGLLGLGDARLQCAFTTEPPPAPDDFTRSDPVMDTSEACDLSVSGRTGVLLATMSQS